MNINQESKLKHIPFRHLGALAIPFLAIACAAKVPNDLVSARRAYEHARTSQAATLAPAELHIASVALAAAEASFNKDPRGYATVDLSYIAYRKAQMAEAQASADSARNSAEASKEAMSDERADQLLSAQSQVANTEGQLAASEASRLAVMAELAKLTAVKDEERGTVITLSGSLLFTSGQSTLLASARTKLDQVLVALTSVKQDSLVIEGHTDSIGTDEFNLALSQRRADAVRSYLVEKGYSASLVTAVGVGEVRPIGSNDSPEGRANNRRVEIVIPRAGLASIR